MIGNPIAGRGRARRQADTLAARLRAAGHEVDVAWSGGAGGARQLASQVPPGLDRLVVVGGDGTLNEVVNGVRDPAAVPLVQLPMGTANILARELGQARSPVAVAQTIEHGRCRRLDMGICGEQRFLALVSAGFDALVVHEVARRRRGSLGFAGYLRPLLSAARRYRAPRLQVYVDGAAVGEGAMVVVSKIRNYGGLFSITDRAACDSGHFDVCLLHRGSLGALLGCAWSAWRGRISRRRDITYCTGQTVRIEAPEPVPVEIDGDPAGTTPADIRLAPAAVAFLVTAS